MRHADVIAAAAPGLLADVLRRFGRVRLRATGTSMLPAITPGDVLLVVRCAFDSLEPGDVVVFSDRTRLYAHRIVDTYRNARGSFFVTRGDSNWRTDPPAHEGQLLGRVNAVRRSGRTVCVDSTRVRRAVGLAASEWIRFLALVLAKRDDWVRSRRAPRRPQAGL